MRVQEPLRSVLPATPKEKKSMANNKDTGEEVAMIDIDRLSDLPDHIIHKVLSFVNIKQAIQTCVLSKRWRFLWASLPYLKFDGYHLEYTTPKDFSDFVTKVLSHRDNSFKVCTFEIYSRWIYLEDVHSLLIDYLISQKLEHFLYVCAYPNYLCHSLSNKILQSKSLKTLELSSVAFYRLPESFVFGLTNLTSLNLSYCLISYETGSFVDPFAACSNLKSLCLLNCSFYRLKVLRISGLQLANLDIQGWLHSSNCCNRVEILAPKLTSFRYRHSNPLDFSQLDLPSLNYADIHVCRSSSYDLEHNLRETQNLINMFRGLHNAQFVRLSSETIEFLDLVPGLLARQPCTFKRLKSLKVNCEDNSFVIPHHVQICLLGDKLPEETLQLEGWSQEAYSKNEEIKVLHLFKLQLNRKENSNIKKLFMS